MFFSYNCNDYSRAVQPSLVQLNRKHTLEYKVATSVCKLLHSLSAERICHYSSTFKDAAGCVAKKTSDLYKMSENVLLRKMELVQ